MLTLKPTRSIVSIFFAFLVAVGFAGVLLPAADANASVKSTPYLSDVYNDDVYKDLSAHQHYWWLYSCFRNVDIDKVTKTEVDNWDFFEGNGSMAALGAMYGNNENTGYYRKCSDQNMVKTAFNYMGFTKSREVFCDITGAKFEDGKDEKDKAGCNAGSGDHDWDNDASLTQVISWYKDTVESKKPGLTNEAKYMRSMATLVEGCEIVFSDDTLYDSPDAVPGASESSEKYAVPVIVKEGNKQIVKFVLGVGSTTDTNALEVATSDYGNGSAILPSTSKTCGTLVNEARSTVASYRDYVEKNGSTEVDDNDDDKNGAGASSTETTCGIDGVGWIVCPVMSFLAIINDKAFGFLEGLLGIRPALIQDEGTMSAWSTFRDLANVMFVIAFMVIVYSQLTSAGVSNYGIKKMLPKIIVAAILVNLSYFVCALMVDISNIAGSSIYSLMDAISQEAVRGGDKVGGAGNTWSDIVGIIIAGAASVLLVVVIIMAPTVLLALAVILLILIARQALVIILIIASPIAFVAYLLPNTEDWFKRWWKAFVAVLMVYPIVGLVFGGSMLVANILMGIAGDGGDGGDDEQLLKIVALGVMAVPLFAVPAILKGSLSAMGSIGTKVAGWSNKADGYAKNKAMQGRLGETKAAFNTRRQARKINRRVGDGISGRINQRLDQSRLGRYIGGDRGSAAAVAAQQRMTKEQIDNSISMLQNGDASTLIQRSVAQLQEANRRGDAVAARAATQVLTTQTGSRGVQSFHNAIRDMEQNGGLNQSVSENIRADVSSAGLKGKDRALDTWSRQEGGLTDLVQHDANQNLTSGLNEAELAGQSAAQLANFAQTGSMTQAQAQRVLAAHERGAIQLEESKLRIFTDRANSTEPLRVEDPGVAREMAEREIINRAHEEALYENTLRNNEANNPSTPRDGQ